MLFELRNPSSADKITHCGVLEFTADEGTVSLPKKKTKTKSSGKLVFGSKGNAANVCLKNESLESPKKKTKTKEFQAFTGKKYSLLG